MSIKIRKVQLSNFSNVREKFCSGCLKSKATGEKSLYQVRLRSYGCAFDIFLCKECMRELKDRMDDLNDDDLNDI